MADLHMPSSKNAQKFDVATQGSHIGLKGIRHTAPTGLWEMTIQGATAFNLDISASSHIVYPGTSALHTFAYLCILMCTCIYLFIPVYTNVYLHLTAYTCAYPYICYSSLNSGHKAFVDLGPRPKL